MEKTINDLILIYKKLQELVKLLQARNKMNILVQKDPPYLGGQEHHVVDLSNYQSKNGDKVYIYFGIGDHPRKSQYNIKKNKAKFLLLFVRIDVLQAFIFGLILFLYHLIKNIRKLI